MFLPSLKKTKTKLCLLVPATLVLFIMILRGDGIGSGFPGDLRHNIWLARGFIHYNALENENSKTQHPTPNKIYAPDCDQLLNGNQLEIKVTKDLLFKEYHKGVPDNHFIYATHNCSRFKTERGYPNVAYSADEQSFPLAYIITVHQHVEQFEHLLHAIYAPQNIYCIHMDRRSSDDFQDAVQYIAKCFQNVFITSKLADIIPGGYGRLKADVNCLRDLSNIDTPWKYVINLAGQDYPLRTNREIVHYASSLEGANDIPSYIPSSPYIKTRYTMKHHIIKDDSGVGKVVPTSLSKSSPPDPNLKIYFGSAYFITTKKFVNHIVNDPFARDFLHWLNDTYGPEEIYWATLNRLHGTPGGSSTELWSAHSHAIIWVDPSGKENAACQGIYHDNVCVFGVGDLKWLTQQNKLFAHKFDIAYDHIVLQCISEWVLRRLKSQINEPSFQNHSVSKLHS